MGEEKIEVYFNNENGSKVTRENGEYSIKEICEMLNVPLEKVIELKESGLDWWEAIYTLGPECYLNILGKLVIPVEAIDCK